MPSDIANNDPIMSPSQYNKTPTKIVTFYHLFCKNNIQMFCRANNRKMSYPDCCSVERMIARIHIQMVLSSKLSQQIISRLLCRGNDRNIWYRDRSVERITTLLSNKKIKQGTPLCSIASQGRFCSKNDHFSFRDTTFQVNVSKSQCLPSKKTLGILPRHPRHPWHRRKCNKQGRSRPMFYTRRGQRWR